MRTSAIQRPKLAYRVALLGAVLFAVLLGDPGAAVAGTTITVTTTADELNSDGDCSLREAIQAANTDTAVDACPAGSGNDVLTLPVGTYALSIAGAGEDNNQSGDLDITSNLTINGAGASSTTVNGSQLDRVMHVVSGTVEINGVTITNGTADFGGGIYNEGTLTISHSTITGNTTSIIGGGIQNSTGTITLTNSTVSDNNTAFDGGGINNWNGVLTATNSTVSGNAANTQGGGIYNDTGGTMTLTNITVSGNTPAVIVNDLGDMLTITNSTIRDSIYEWGGPISVRNSIVAGCSGTLTSQGYNLIQGTGGCTITGDTTGNITGQDPKLGALAANGGPTFTHALLASSPAIDAGNPATPGSGGTACEATDQRGVARPQGPRCDIGAFELVQAVPTPTPTPTPTPVPSVSTLGMLALSVLLMTAVLWARRRRLVP